MFKRGLLKFALFEMTIIGVTSAVTLQMQRGWNLIGVPCQVNATTFLRPNLRDKIVVVWKADFTNNGQQIIWKGISPRPQAQQWLIEHGFQRFDHIRPYEGFFIYAAQPFRLSLCSNNSNTEVNWLVLVYMAADNNLEPFAYRDLSEIQQVIFPSNVKVSVLLDTPSLTAIYSTNTEGHVVLERELEGIDTGAPETLINFVRDNVYRYNPRKIALILWDHGDNWRYIRNSLKLVAYDSTNEDILYLYELRNALRNLQNDNIRINLLGIDACLAGSIETLFALKDVVADYIVASEKTEPGDGWYYTSFLQVLSENPNISTRDLAINIVDSYANFYQNNEEYCYTGCTLAAYPVWVIEPIINNLNNLSLNLQNLDISYIYNIRSNISNIDSQVLDAIDLKDFVDRLNSTNTYNISYYANNISYYIDQIYFRGVNIPSYLHGISITFPLNRSQFNSCYISTPSNPCNEGYGSFYNIFTETQWDEFLRWYLDHIEN